MRDRMFECCERAVFRVPEIINTGPEKVNGAERKIYDMKKTARKLAAQASNAVWNQNPARK